MLQPTRPGQAPAHPLPAVGALIAENGRLREALAAAEARLRDANARVAALEAASSPAQSGANVLGGSVLESAHDCLITVDERDRVVEWGPAAERMFGYARAEALGRELGDLIIPEEVGQVHRRRSERHLAVAIGLVPEGVAERRQEVEVRRADGGRLIVELTISPVMLDGGRQLTARLREAPEHVVGEAALRDGESRLRTTCEHALVGIGEVDASGRFLRVNRQFTQITGFESGELLARGFADITHPEDRERDLARFAELMAGETGPYMIEKRCLRKNGEAVWVEVGASRVDDAAGRPIYGILVVRDISEWKRGEAIRTLMVDEMTHRVKNTLATVQAIVAQALRTRSEPEDIRAAVEGRLVALGRVHGVLARETWQGARLREVLTQAVEPFLTCGPARVTLDGPEIWLPPPAALALAMASQELVTNAVKYGALSAPGGTVAIAWSVEPREGGRHLALVWEERGGPPVTPPTRRGFGSRLLERGIAAQLGGRVELEYRRAGVCCAIDVDLG